MHERLWRSIAGLVAVNVLAAVAAGQAVELGEPIELPHCGIALSLPAGCELGPLAEPHQLLLAIETQGDQRVLGVTLSAYPVEPEMTADEFADAMVAYLRRQLVVRNMEEVAAMPIETAAISGVMRVLTYNLRGQATIAASACFVRPSRDAEISICYVLTVESPADRGDDIQAVLEAVAATVLFQPIEPPSLTDCGQEGEPVTMHELGFSIRPPSQWFAAAMPTGVQMGQVDYTLGGEVMPGAQVTVAPLQPGDDASQCASCAVDIVRRIAESADVDVEVVSQGPAVMADVEGYQFVVRQRPHVDQDDSPASDDGAPQDGPDDGVVIVQRVICVAAPEDQGGARSYSLTLVCHGSRTGPAEALMDSLAEGFELTPIAGRVADDADDDGDDDSAAD